MQLNYLFCVIVDTVKKSIRKKKSINSNQIESNCLPGQIGSAPGRIWPLGRMFDTPALANALVMRFSSTLNKFC